MAIKVKDLTVRRGGRYVLEGLSVDVRPGLVTGLLGPNACGKTTLMRSIAGVQKIQSGAVEVLGEPAGSPALRRRLGYVTQAPSVYLDLTVRENLRYFSRILNSPPDRADAVVETVGLRQHGHEVASKLSGGQRAGLSLATALLGDPDLLILDEPTVGLDPVLREHLWTTFHNLAAGGCTLMVSSHVMDEARNCDHLLLMRAGKILTSEAPAELLRRTGANDLEAAFLQLIKGDGVTV